jgi:hypothetical protein
MRRLAHILLSVWLWLAALSVEAQDLPAGGCLETLSIAEAEFAAGRFYGIPAILKSCIDDKAYSNEQLVRVYLLLSQVYLLIDDPIGAEQSYLKLLEADPEYLATEEKDPIDVFFLSKKFTSTPIFTPHFKGGITASRPFVLRDFNPTGDMRNVRRSIKTGLGWTVGSGIEWNATDNLGLGGELFFSYKTFSINYSGMFQDDLLETTEKQFWIDLPMYVRYTKAIGRTRPFGYVGHSFHFLINAELASRYTDSNGGTATEQVVVEGPDLPVTFNRRMLNRSLLFGGGLKVKSGKDFFIIDLRYQAGLTNLSKGSLYNSGSKSSSELFSGATRYGALSNDFRLNGAMLTVGYVRPLYDPRKIKKSRNKSLRD